MTCEPPGPGDVPTVDAHLHVWDLATGDYGWLTPEHGPLHATVTPARATAELAAAGVGRAVLVQAADTDGDTDRMLAAADADDRIAGVVGWVPLEDTATAVARLDDVGDRLCGVRQLIHDDPRTGVLELPPIRETLREISAHGAAFDVPDAWPSILADVPGLADALPELTVVLDHLGKPPADPDARPRWAELVAAVAVRPNTVAKLSGLQHLPSTALPEVIDTALELFGPDRLLWGSDWPMPLGGSGYRGILDAVLPLVGALSPAERAAVLGRTATRVYALPALDAQKTPC